MRRHERASSQPSLLVVCTENSVRIDYMTESPNVSGDDRSVMLPRLEARARESSSILPAGDREGRKKAGGTQHKGDFQWPGLGQLQLPMTKRAERTWTMFDAFI